MRSEQLPSLQPFRRSARPPIVCSPFLATGMFIAYLTVDDCYFHGYSCRLRLSSARGAMMAWHSWRKCENCGGYKPTSVGDERDRPPTGGRQQRVVGEQPPGPLCRCDKRDGAENV